MRKIFFNAISLIIFLTSSAQCAVWSSMTADGIQGYFFALSALVSANEEAIRGIWSADIKPVLNDIRKGTTEKKMTLEQISSLETEINILQKKKIFLLEQEKQLLGKMADVESIKE